MFLDGADADAEIVGDPALRLEIDPKAPENHPSPFGQTVENTLKDRKLLPGNEHRLDRRRFVHRAVASSTKLGPFLLAPDAAPGRPPPSGKMVAGHSIKIGAGLRDGTDIVGQ